jgi:hypothetical protein
MNLRRRGKTENQDRGKQELRYGSAILQLIAAPNGAKSFAQLELF